MGAAGAGAAGGGVTGWPRRILAGLFYGGLALELAGVAFGLVAIDRPLPARLAPLLLGYLLLLGAYLAGFRVPPARPRGGQGRPRYAAVNRAPLRPGQAAAFVALWEAVLPRVLAFPGCRSAIVLVDEAAGQAASVVLYDTAAHAAAVPSDPAYFLALADLDAILDLAAATREVYAVALVDVAAPGRRWWRGGR